jgi:hypothetical protein
MIARPHRIDLRTPRKVMSTTYGNEIADAVNGLPYPFLSGNTEDGDPARPYFLGKITDAGPGNEDDYTDERYWVQREYLASGKVDDRLTLKDDTYDPAADPDGPADANPNVVTVTNLPERKNGSHALLKDTAVVVFVESDVGDGDSAPVRPHYVMCVVAPQMIPVTLSTDGGGNGTATTAPGWTYKLTYNGKTVATNQTPRNRRTIGIYTAADFGYAHLDAGSGSYALGWCNEGEQAEACPT